MRNSHLYQADFFILSSFFWKETSFSHVFDFQSTTIYGFCLRCIRRDEVQLSLYAFIIVKGELEIALLWLFLLMEMRFVDQLK